MSKKVLTKSKKIFSPKIPSPLEAKVKGTKLDVIIIKDFYGKSPKEHHFIAADGAILKDLKDLLLHMGRMGDDIFYQHVRDGRNDFAQWIDDILKEKKLAADLRKAYNKGEHQVVVLEHLLQKLEKRMR